MRNLLHFLDKVWFNAKVISKFTKSLFKDENERRVIWWLVQYFDHNNIDRKTIEIHHIEVKTKQEEILVIITLGRPGLMIGKGGERINKIQKEISEHFEKNVKITLQEYSVWD